MKTIEIGNVERVLAIKDNLEKLYPEPQIMKLKQFVITSRKLSIVVQRKINIKTPLNTRLKTSIINITHRLQISVQCYSQK